MFKIKIKGIFLGKVTLYTKKHSLQYKGVKKYELFMVDHFTCAVRRKFLWL